MSQITASVRDAARALHSKVHASRVDCLVAALGDDPETIDELQAALRRFMHVEEQRQFFDAWQPGVSLEPSAGGLCIIDLRARILVAPPNGDVAWDAAGVALTGPGGKEVLVPYHLSKDWLIVSDAREWEAHHRARADARHALPPLDARPVLYGEVCRFIAEACAAAVEGGAKSPGDDPASREAVSEIHARWLTAPRDDLRGLAPRDVLLQQRNHLGWQLQDRSEYWSITGAAPPALSKESFAYRFGGFGTHEIVMYYNLVRFLITDSWDRLVANGGRADDLAAEVGRLEELRDEWLRTPDVLDLHGRTPASVIERERVRLPEAMTPAEAVVDHDCPMCQMMADLPGPMFWGLDGCNMDQGFAFSFHLTREEWEAEQREYEEMSRRIDERLAEKGSRADSPWRSSYGAEEAADLPPVLALYRLAAHLGELTQDLKDAGADHALIDDLNRTFGNLREVSDPPNHELIDPVLDRLCESLAAAATACPALAGKANDLERQLDEFGRRMTEPPVDDDVWF